MDPYAHLLYAPLGDHTHGAEPATEFDASYVLPGHKRRLALEVLHEHPRDAGIRFEEDPHLYLITPPDGGPVFQAAHSVTSVAGKCGYPFDATAVIAGMRKPPHAYAQAWPRSGYCTDEREYDETAPFPKKCGILVRSIDAEGKPFTHAAMTSAATNKAGLVGADASGVKSAILPLVDKCRKRPHGPLEFRVFTRCNTEAEMLALWDANSTEACNRGTEAHFWAEQYLNGLTMHEAPELTVCRKFCADFMLPAGARPYRTEWELYTDPDVEGVAGSVDLVTQYPDGSLGIVDWKRSDKLMGGLWSFGKEAKGMMAPLDHLDCCDGAKYGMQLNLYMYILEKYYGFTVSSLTLCSLHPDKPFATDVPRMPLETVYLMATERRYRGACRWLEANWKDTGSPRVLCQRTGRVRTNPKIVVSTGEEIQHGAAFIGEELGPLGCDQEGQRAVEAAIQSVGALEEEDAVLDAAAEALMAGRNEWREMMPKPGLLDCMRDPCTGQPVGQLRSPKRARVESA